MGANETPGKLVGRHALVGISRVAQDGSLLGIEQFHGTIVSVGDDGIAVRLALPEGLGLRWLPPAPQAFSAAVPGEYRLTSTGEVVIDPDVIAQFTIRVSDPGRLAAEGPTDDPRPFRPAGPAPS